MHQPLPTSLVHGVSGLLTYSVPEDQFDDDGSLYSTSNILDVSYDLEGLTGTSDVCGSHTQDEINAWVECNMCDMVNEMTSISNGTLFNPFSE